MLEYLPTRVRVVYTGGAAMVHPSSRPIHQLREASDDQNKPHECAPVEFRVSYGTVKEVRVVGLKFAFSTSVVDSAHETSRKTVLPPESELLQGVSLR